MANTTETNLDIITSALRLTTVINEISAPSAEQGAACLVLLNNMITNMEADLGTSIGWYPQTTLSAVAPLQDQDIRAIKLLLAVDICLNWTIPIPPELGESAGGSAKALIKRYITYVESDLTGLPFAQGGLFGPGRV